MSQLVATLLKHGKIDQNMHDKVLQFVAENRFDKQVPEVPEKKAKAVKNICGSLLYSFQPIYLSCQSI